MAEADLIITHAHVFDGEAVSPNVRAVAIQGQKIVGCGNPAEVGAWQGRRTRVIDAGGGSLLPGLIDSHFHLLYGALNRDGMQLDAVTQYEELATTLRAYAADHPDLPWLAGTGLRYNTGPNQGSLTRQHLDAMVADRPIYLNAFDGHTSWANTLALKLGGIFHGGPASANSEIVLDAQGEATGELREPGAFQPVSRLVPKPSRARQRSLVREALQLAASLGLTSVHNMNSSPEEVELYAELFDLGALTCRIYLPFSISPDTPFEALATEALALKQIQRGNILRGGTVKLFVDGVIESYTGLLVEPYADLPSSCGAAQYEKEHFERMVIEADRLGFQVCTHAVGDLGVRWALDAYAAAQRANGRTDARHRIEHIELVHPVDLPRFAQLGVIASMQPLHAPARVEAEDVWPVRVGPERWPNSFAWQDLRAAGATLIFGSDWPVVTPDPMRGMAHAVSRAAWAPGLPNQRQTLDQALRAYTRDAAYGEFQEHCKGQIRRGYLADLVLFEKDLCELSLEALAQARPQMTIMDGRVIYER